MPGQGPDLRVLTDDDPQYAALMDQATDPASGVRLVALRQLGGGRHEGTFVAGRRNNPAGEVLFHGKITAGARAYSGALRDYANWKSAWWREAIQNAVDAGATSVALEVVEDDQAVRVSCTDNGTGMSVEILTQKFLRWTETGKTIAGKTLGGFGVAKALLVFPWLMWEIHTRDLLARRTDTNDPSVYDVMSAPYFQGTRLTVWMDKSEYTTVEVAKTLIARCYLPNVTFTVNGVAVSAATEPGGELEGGQTMVEYAAMDSSGKRVPGRGMVSLRVFHNDKVDGSSQRVDVRLRGLVMFYTYTESVPGRIVCEVDIAEGVPVEAVFISSRDRFSSDSLTRALSNLVNTIATNLTALLLLSKGIKGYRFSSDKGLIRANEQESIASRAHRNLPYLEPKTYARDAESRDVGYERQQVPPQEVKQITRDVQEAQEALRQERQERGAPLRMETGVTTELIQTHLSQGFTTNDELQNAVKLLAWMPDTYVFNAVGSELDPFLPQFFPETMNKMTRRLLRLWAEYCRFILIRLNRFEPFGVGFVLNNSVGGLCKTEDDGTTFVLVNPVRIVDNTRYGQGIKLVPRFRLTDEASLMDMFSTALHEVTHLLGYGDHGDAFCGALSDFTGKLLNVWTACRKIQEEVSKAEIALSRAQAEAKAASRGRKVSAKADAVLATQAVQIAQLSSFGNTPTLVPVAAAYLQQVLANGASLYETRDAIYQQYLTAYDDAYEISTAMMNMVGEALYFVGQAEVALSDWPAEDDGTIKVNVANDLYLKASDAAGSLEFVLACVDYAWAKLHPTAAQAPKKAVTPAALGKALDALLRTAITAEMHADPDADDTLRKYQLVWSAITLPSVTSRNEAGYAAESALSEEFPYFYYQYAMDIGHALWIVWRAVQDCEQKIQKKSDSPWTDKELIEHAQYNMGVSKATAEGVVRYVKLLSSYLGPAEAAPKAERKGAKGFPAVPGQQGRPPAVLDGMTEAYKYAWRLMSAAGENYRKFEIETALVEAGVPDAVAIAEVLDGEKNTLDFFLYNLRQGSTVAQLREQAAQLDPSTYAASYRMDALLKHAVKVYREERK